MNPTAYAPAVAELLAVPCPMPLGPGTPDRSVADRIRLVTIPGVRDASVGACRAGLWLRFNHLDESHAISQADESDPDRNFWHAVMHRREPDPDNSKYWWRRVGPHPVLDQLRTAAAAIGYTFISPYDFVDYCEAMRDTGGQGEELAERVQMLEWQLLFDWCYRKAVG
jgi:hypothetical protein